MFLIRYHLSFFGNKVVHFLSNVSEQYQNVIKNSTLKKGWLSLNRCPVTSYKCHFCPPFKFLMFSFTVNFYSKSCGIELNKELVRQEI